MVYTIFSTSTKHQHLNVYQACTLTFIFYTCNTNSAEDIPDKKTTTINTFNIAIHTYLYFILWWKT